MLAMEIEPKNIDLRWIEMYIKTNIIDPTAHIKSSFAILYISILDIILEWASKRTPSGCFISSLQMSITSLEKSLKYSF